MSRLLFYFILFMSTAFLAKADIDDKGVQALLDGDYQTAYAELMPLAERGHPRSLYNIAYMYFNGLGLDQNRDEAFKFYEQAAEKGFPLAFHQIGFYFDNGIDRDVNVQEAVKWYEKAAEKGVLISHHNLGFIYDTGRLTGQRDPAEAARWYTFASEQGYASSQVNLGIMYDDGDGVIQDDKEAVRLFTLAANQGSPNGIWRLALMYIHGEGVPQDDNKGLELTTKAAELNLPEAQHDLGLYYADGQHGVKQDKSIAAQWYRRAAEQGFAGSQVNLGVLYDGGDGVPLNDEEAFKWFTLAANQNQPLGQYYLGTMYEFGEGIDQNFDEAGKWYSTACDNSNQPDACHHLAYLFQNGSLSSDNPFLVPSLYEKAAEEGHVESQFRLGTILYFGELNGLIDKVQAYMMFNIAAMNGHETAIQNRDVMVGELTSAELEKGQSLAKQCLDKNLQDCICWDCLQPSN